MDFSQISLLLAAAAFFGIVAKKFQQPILIGYLATGFLLAAGGVIKDHHLIENLGNIGVTLLLFLVGLEMNVRELTAIGKVAFFAGIGQIIVTFALGILVGILLGFDIVISSYLAIAITFSSTIIVMKILSENNTLNSLYGKISIGILLIQDFAAIFVLIFLAGVNNAVSGVDYIFIVLKALLLFLIIWLFSRKLLPYLFEKYVASSPELVFITSIAWALGLASLVAGPLGFSLEMGGLLAGLALSNLPEHLEIGSRTKPLKDFFLTIFFLSLGASLVVDDIGQVVIPALIYSILVVVFKPIILMIFLGLMNLRKRTSFLTSLSISQISEFSLKIVAVGVALGHLQKEHLALSVIIAIITMTVSTYLLRSVDVVYLKLKSALSIFERRYPKDLVSLRDENISDHIVLIGCLRTGIRLISYFKKIKTPYVIIDFNPDIYKRLSAGGHTVIFGDITDPDIMEAARIDKAKMIISTIDNISDNSRILEHIAKLPKKPLSIFTSITRTNALKIYERGADYVVVPEIVAGDHIRNLLRIYGIKSHRLRKAGQNHFNRLIFS